MGFFSGMGGARLSAVLAGLGMAVFPTVPVWAQLSDAQVCVNPKLKDTVLNGAKPGNVQATDKSKLAQILRSGAQMALTNDTLVSRTTNEIVCRYDAVFTKAGAADITAKFIIKVTSGANGSANIDGYIE